MMQTTFSEQSLNYIYIVGWRRGTPVAHSVRRCLVVVVVFVFNVPPTAKVNGDVATA